MSNVATLVLRLVYGGLLAGHGGQKLFGWFGGHGLKGTGMWLESMGMQPGEDWARAAVASEFGGGVLTAAGFLNPLGPVLSMGSMAMAALTVHRGKPIWVSEGGAELPVTNLAIATALALAGPGTLSLDELLGTRLPRWLVVPGVLATAGGVALALASRQQQRQQAHQHEQAQQREQQIEHPEAQAQVKPA